MEGPMRIVAADFSLGALSPEFAGRVDSPAFHKGVQEMTNAEPYGLGGFHRSPGTMYVGDTRSNLEAFLVPWMVTADLSLIIEFTEGHIRLLGGDPTDKYTFMSPVEQSGAGVIDITDLDPTSVSNVPAYTLAHAKQIDWSKSNTEIVFAHKLYPLFFFRLLSDGGVTAGVRSITFEYGLAPITGSIAIFSSETRSWDSSELYAQIASWMANGVTYQVSGSINQMNLASGIMNDGVLSLGVSSTVAVTTVSASPSIAIEAGSDFNSNMVGLSISGTGIPANTTILSYDSGTNAAVMSNNATGNASITATLSGLMEIEKGTLVLYPGSVSMELVPCSKSGKYPGTVAFFNNRLVLSGSVDEPSTVYASRPGNHFDFSLLETLEYDVTQEKEPSDPDIYSYSCRLQSNSSMKYKGKLTTMSSFLDCSATSGSMVLSGTGSLNTDAMIGSVVSGPRIASGSVIVSYDNTAKTITLDKNATSSGSTRIAISSVLPSGPDWSSDLSGWKISGGNVIAVPAAFSFPSGTKITSVSSTNMITFSPALPANVYPPSGGPFTGLATVLYNNDIQVILTEPVDSLTPEYETVQKTTQQIGADNAMKVVLNTAEDESVMWMETQGDLVIGTKTSEWIIAAQSDPTNVSAQVVSRHGSARQKPCKLGGSLIYIQDSRRIVKEFGETGSRTVNELSNHLFKGTGKDIVDFDYTQAPEEAMYFVLSDGSMVKCLLNASAQTIAWTVRKPRTGDKYESVAVLASTHGDLVYCSVKRGSLRYVEVIAMNDDTGILGQCHSGACHYGVVAGTSVTVNRLANQVVSVRGVVTGSSPAQYVDLSVQVSPSGVVTFVDSLSQTISLSSYMIGLPESMRVVLQRLDTMDTEGLVKTLTQISMRLYKSSTFTLRYKDDVTAGDYPSSEIDCGTAESFSGIYRTTFGGPWDDDQRIIVECATAGPVGVLSVISDLTIGSGG